MNVSAMVNIANNHSTVLKDAIGTPANPIVADLDLCSTRLAARQR